MEAGIGKNEAAIDRLATPVPVPTRSAQGQRVIGLVAAAGRRVVAAVASRRRRGAFQQEEFSAAWTAGLTRGLTLFVGDRAPGASGR